MKLIWIAVEKTCNVCKGGTAIPPFGCWKCNGKGAYQVARLAEQTGTQAAAQAPRNCDDVTNGAAAASLSVGE